VLLHGTSGTGRNWLLPSLAGELFGEGQPLDASRYFIIMPDGIGRGGSSKPSDGLRAKFPHYRYRDIIASEVRLVTEELGIKHLRLVLGSSMGGMHAWMWGEMYPGLMDALVPIASQPIEISGRNWIGRRIAIEAIRHDPDWNEGNYTTKPTHYIHTAPYGALMTESPVRLQEMAATREAADALYRKWVAEVAKGDANDQLYATEAVLGYTRRRSSARSQPACSPSTSPTTRSTRPSSASSSRRSGRSRAHNSSWYRRAPRRTGTSRICARRSGNPISPPS
jgi:homoserine O-acetyltransferase